MNVNPIALIVNSGVLAVLNTIGLSAVEFYLFNFFLFRHNIVLVERDYSLIEGCQHLHFPDIDVDESCGVVLQPLIDLKDDSTLQALISKILALSLKLTVCWILLYSDRPNWYVSS